MADTILQTILAHKKMEMAQRRREVPFAEIRDRAADQPPTRDFTAALRRPRLGKVALIAEVKKASPTAGLIRADFDAVQIARTYEDSGADCLSVLTDERFFQGHDEFLKAVRKSVNLPLLRKDFTVDPYQIYEARVLGADAILLIASALTPYQIQDYSAVARSLGLQALVEVHSVSEMQVASHAGATLIGINSRDLSTFVTDLGIVERLASMVGPGATLVAESGIKTPADITRVREAGAHAILVGETLMRAEDIGGAVRALLG
ncbi:indole-3-glycerol-phosphate synthase [Capsulimonas corticalis]|uniref:Indole-3-glycerol phosphate synthase n=1 Tax=Capsulimonas corticalis TaxID=2219043 RepID=A0A402D2E9_9BACT|nr:indole-3-glycerol phosphate synthase TrpC [Capsulimonas corticalis]BDI30014.1 indole-3-glycerol-phosphate synthase [Capsulimonas corticalis]